MQTTVPSDRTCQRVSKIIPRRPPIDSQSFGRRIIGFDGHLETLSSLSLKRRSRSRRIASLPSIRSFEFRHTTVKDRCQYRRVVGIPDQTACGISLHRSIGTTVHNRTFIHTPGYGTGHRADHHARRGEHDITNIGRSNRPEQS